MAQVRPPSGAGVFYARSSSFFEKMQCVDNQRCVLDSEALKCMFKSIDTLMS